MFMQRLVQCHSFSAGASGHSCNTNNHDDSNNNNSQLMLFPPRIHCQRPPCRAQITVFHCRLLVSTRGHSSINLPHPLQQKKNLPILPLRFLFNYHSCFLIWKNPSFLYLISLSRSYYSASCNTNYYASCMPARLMSYIKDGEFWNLQREIQHECDAKKGDTSIFQIKENHSPNK